MIKIYQVTELLMTITQIHYGPVKPYDNIALSQHWLGWWLGAVMHQAITWTNLDLPSKVLYAIHLRAILQEMLKICILDMNLILKQLGHLLSMKPSHDTPYYHFISDIFHSESKLHCAKAPGHQYPQCWLNIHHIGPVSYWNITVIEKIL